jgi:hypothetical protein
MIEDEAIDRAEAAGQFERIEQFRVAGDGHFDAVGRRRFYSGAQREARGAVADKFDKALGLKSSTKNDGRDLIHGSIRTQQS